MLDMLAPNSFPNVGHESVGQEGSDYMAQIR